MKIHRIFVVITCLLSPIYTFSAEQRLTSEKQFSVWRSNFSDPITKADFESLIPSLKEDGFTSPDKMMWKMSDKAGTVMIMALPERGSFWVHYFPSVPTPLGDAALAAMINKASSIEISDGDSMTLAVSHRTIVKESKKGEYSEYLTVNLRGGAWQETIVHIQWTK
jgi:hypothetical protein